MPQWILLATLALALYGTGQVWLVQLSSYRLWRYVGPAELHDYHWAWWRSIWGVVLAPAGLVFLGAIAMLRWRPAGMSQAEAWAGAALQLLLAGGTAAWWGPLMARLETPDGSLDAPRYRLLMTTHWLRVALVTAYALLLFWIAARELGLG